MASVIGAAVQPIDASTPDRAALILEVNDADATYAELLAKGVQFLQPPADQPAWSRRTTYLRDPDGTLIEINHSTWRS
jgi:catechol 2,3-dioxygenase-like lactoylglutathione lyase family enzyme